MESTLSLENTKITNYERKFRRIIGYDVVVSIAWFQYFQMRLQYHSANLYEPSFWEVLWTAQINPTLIGIIMSSLSAWICFSGLKIIKEGKELKKIRSGTAFSLTLWWGIFLPIELVTLAIYAITIRNLSSGWDVVARIFRTIIESFI